MLFSALPIIALAKEESDGLSFESDTLYKVTDIYSEPINTFAAEVCFPANMSSSTRGGVIIGNWGQGDPNVSLEVYTNGNPRLYITDKDGKVTNLVFDKINLYNGEKTHIAIVRDSASSLAHCYINGTLAQSLPCSYTADISVTRSMSIGGDYRSGNAQYFKGEIFSVALYSEPHSATEIAQDIKNYANGAGLIACYYSYQLDEDGSIFDLSGNDYYAKKSSLWIDQKEPVTDYAYSFAVVGDTQIIAKHHPDKFSKIYDYIVDNIDSKNIQFVLGLGDITDGDSDAEWNIAKENIFKLDGKVNYSIVRGNHDSKSKFNSAFPYSKYSDVIGGTYDSTMLNTWQELVVGEVKYMIFTLDYGASDSVLNWAAEIIDANPDYNVIITTHAYLYRDGTTLDQGDVCPPATSGGYNNGDHMWDKLIANHENIVLVISGHDPCNRVVMAQDEGECGNTVTQLLVDPQGMDADMGATGMVAMLYFSEDGKNVSVEYYSTIREQYFMSENQFSFTLDLAGDEIIEKEYALTIEGAAKPVNQLKDSYVSGEEITIKLPAITDGSYRLILNNKPLPEGDTTTESGYVIFTFTMPRKDSSIKIQKAPTKTPSATDPSDDTTDKESSTAESTPKAQSGCTSFAESTLLLLLCSILSCAFITKRRKY